MVEKWHILGAGAMGSLLACHLFRAGQPAQLLYRSSSAAAKRGSPIRLWDGEEQFSLPVEQGLITDADPIRQLLICTKAHQALDALAPIRSRMDGECPVLLLHNGMGTLAEAQKLLGPGREIFCGVTTEAAHWDPHGALVYAGRGTTQLGSILPQEPPPWFAPLALALPRLNWDSDIQHSLWSKLLVNCAINPLTARYGCRNGELVQHCGPELESLCQELAIVARTLGYPDLAEGLHQTVLQVCAATAGNHSSMLTDVRSGRRTEIDSITGHLCRVAAELNIETPLNSALLQNLKALEAQGH